MDLAEPSIIGAYTMQAANDCPDRDPTDWILLGKAADDGCYVELSRVTGATFSRRYARQTFPISVRTAVTAVRWEITKRLGPGVAGHIQLAHVAVHPAAIAPPSGARRHALTHGSQSPLVCNEVAIYEGQRSAHTGVVVAEPGTDSGAAAASSGKPGSVIASTSSTSSVRPRRGSGGAAGGAGIAIGRGVAANKLSRGSRAWWSPLPTDRRAFFTATIQGGAASICGFSLRSSARPGSFLRDPLSWRLQAKERSGSWVLLTDVSEELIRWAPDERGATRYFELPNAVRGTTFTEVKFEVRGSIGGAAVEIGGFALYGGE